MDFLVLQYQSGTYGRLEKGQSKPKYLTAMLLNGNLQEAENSDPAKSQSAQKGI